MQMTRREMLKLGLFGSAALLLPLQRAARTAGVDRLRRLPRPFVAELSVPQALKPGRTPGGADFYEMTMKKAAAEVLPGMQTEVWGYDGLFPGPLIRARRGREVVVRHNNGLPVDTSVHLHGAYVDGDSDGHASDMIRPGASKTYVYPNDQTARTQWFHDHAMHLTATNVYKGLAGLYLIEDDFEDNLPLPKEEFDVPLVIQDRLFDADGQFLYPFDEGDHSANGVLGDVVLVNGKPWPRMAVSARKYRFRVLNGSNARLYELALSSGRPLVQIATEGGLRHRPLPVRSLPVASGERHEVVIDFSEYPVGTQVVLMNLSGKEGASRVMRFDVVRKAADDSAVPAVLRPPEEQVDPTHLPAEPSEAAVTRRFRFERSHGYWSINGKTYEEGRIDARPRAGDAEIWEFENKSGGWIHPVHVHLVNFRVLSRNGGPPAPHEAAWKDTVYLSPNQTARVLMKWPEVPLGPNPGPFARRYVFHCHLVEHEDHDMMLQFEVSGAR